MEIFQEPINAKCSIPASEPSRFYDVLYFQELQTTMHLYKTVQQAVSSRSTPYLDFVHHLFMLLSSMYQC
jgi:hypothetical protein